MSAQASSPAGLEPWLLWLFIPYIGFFLIPAVSSLHLVLLCSLFSSPHFLFLMHFLKSFYQAPGSPAASAPPDLGSVQTLSFSSSSSAQNSSDSVFPHPFTSPALDFVIFVPLLTLHSFLTFYHLGHLIFFHPHLVSLRLFLRIVFSPWNFPFVLCWLLSFSSLLLTQFCWVWFPFFLPECPSPASSPLSSESQLCHCPLPCFPHPQGLSGIPLAEGLLWRELNVSKTHHQLQKFGVRPLVPPLGSVTRVTMPELA